MTEFLIVLGVIVLAFALRSYDHPIPRKLGAIMILAATYLAAWFIVGSHAAGIGAVLAWFLLPWIELLTRIRKLRLPVRKVLTQQAPPNSHRFPHLNEFTTEIEEAGFEYAADTGWEWEDLSQFFRIFYDAKSRTQAAICLNEQQNISFAFITLTSRTADGRTFRTWNYPFSYTMKLAPEMRMNRVSQAGSFENLLFEHRDFLERLGIDAAALVDEDPKKLPELIELETARQIKHNLDRGLIAMAEDAERFRYSWRGLFYLYGQLVKDMVKLS
jgi:hypothetical protein